MTLCPFALGVKAAPVVLPGDGLLMLGVWDVINLQRPLPISDIEAGRVSGADFYEVAPAVTELFEPLEPDGPLFQLLWRKKV